MKNQDSKYESLVKEHEIVKEKLEKALKDLILEKETKSKTINASFGLKNDDNQLGKYLFSNFFITGAFLILFIFLHHFITVKIWFLKLKIFELYLQRRKN